MSPRARFVVRIVVAAVILTVILSRIDREGLTVHAGPALAGGVLLGALLLLASQALAALRWRIVLGVHGMPWSYLTRLYVVSAFFNLFLPTAVGGDAVRAAAAAQAAGRAGTMVSSVVLDRLLGVAALFVYGALGLVVAGGLPDALLQAVAWKLTTGATLALAGAGLAGAAAAWWLVRRSARLQRLARDAWDVVLSLARRPAALARALGLAMLVQGLIILIWIVLARAAGLSIPAAAFLVAVPVVVLGSMAPITLGGLGVREGIWLLLLAGSGIPSADVVVFSLMYFASAVVVGLVGLLLFVTLGVAPPASMAGAADTR